MNGDAWTDDRLAGVLGAIADDLDLEPSRRPGRAWGTWAALIVVVLAAAVLAVGPTRRTVGGWLRIGPVELRGVSDLAVPRARVPGFASGRPIRASEVAALTGHDADELTGSRLGPPDAWLAPGEGGALAVWHRDRTTLWIAPADDWSVELVTKQVAAEQVAVLDLGDGGVLISGDHLVTVDGDDVPAATTVVWRDGDVVLRLESVAADDDVLALAHRVSEELGGAE